MAGELGRLPPTDDRHLLRYPLTAATIPAPPTPVVIGVNWFENFDAPVPKRNGAVTEWWVGLSPSLGSVRGGHCVCLPPHPITDLLAWWTFYDQGQEGACCGFGASRMMSLLNRRRYAALQLYYDARRIDEWPGEDYDGTSVRATMDVLREAGHRRIMAGGRVHEPDPAEGIAANRWALSMADVYACLSSPYYERRGAVPLLNSWGRDGYPHIVWVPEGVIEPLLFRWDGEATCITDR